MSSRATFFTSTSISGTELFVMNFLMMSSERYAFRNRSVWHFGRSHRCSSEDPLQDSDRRPSCRSAKDMVGKRRDFQKRIDRRKKSDEKDRECLNELYGRDRPFGLKIEDAQ